MKRFRSFLIVFFAIFVFVLVPTISQAAYFSDIPTSLNSDFFDAINYMSDNVFMVGDGNGKFLPSKELSRGACVVALYSYSRDKGTYTHPFTDVDSSMYYNDAVAWAYQNGIVSGTSATTFSPTTIINRQQLMIILYAYATNYLGKTYSDSNVISGYSDYSNVSSYAVTAMNWAKCRNILPALNSDVFLSPKKSVTRDETALFIWRFQRYVEKFRRGEENYSFNNSYGNFTSTYEVSASDYNKICEAIYNYYGTDSARAKSQINVIDSNIRSTWVGSCYGMAITSIFDKLGILAFNENFDTDKTTMNDVSSPKNTPSVRSAINSYQVSQSLGFMSTPYYAGSNLRNGLSGFVNAVKNGGPVLFCYFYPSNGTTVGHAIVAYECIQNTNGSFTIYTYDNNYPNNETYISINSAYTTCTVNNSNNIKTPTGISFVNDFSNHRYLDLDGVYNNNQNNTSQTNMITSNYDVGDKVNITITTFDNFALTNADGDTLTFTNGSIGGNMTVYSQSLAIKGQDVECDLTISVDYSESFTLSCTDEYRIAVSSDEYCIVAEGTGAESIQINNDNSVSIIGNTPSFKVQHAPFNSFTDIVTLYGSGDEEICIEFNETNFVAEGLNSNLNIIYKDAETLIEDDFISIPIVGSSVIEY